MELKANNVSIWSLIKDASKVAMKAAVVANDASKNVARAAIVATNAKVESYGTVKQVTAPKVDTQSCI